MAVTSKWNNKRWLILKAIEWLLCRVSSVTGFVEISPLWQNFKSLWLFLASLFSVWQNIEQTLVIFYAIGLYHLIVVDIQILNI